MVISRRQLLKGSASGLGLLVAGQAGMLRLATPAFAVPPGEGAFGGLRPDPAGLLDLPAGFRYDIVTQAGQPLAGSEGVGGLTPGRPDGTAAFAGILAKTYLVMNHEQGTSAAFPATAEARFTYDPGALGGTSTLRLDNRNRLEEQYVSLAGTVNNCAGGPTPWGTWLTCEETEARAGGALTRDHGWVFEVSPWFQIVNQDPEPLTALGRFAHEAVTIDPLRGHVYLTEDASNPNGLLYRFTPAAWPGRIHSLRDGGTLEAMRVPGVADLSSVSALGTTLPVTWVPVPDRVGRHHVDPQAVHLPGLSQRGDGVGRRGRRHPQPQVRGRVVGPGQGLHRLLVRPGGGRLERGRPRRPGVVVRPGPGRAAAGGLLRPQPRPLRRRGRPARRARQHHGRARTAGCSWPRTARGPSTWWRWPTTARRRCSPATRSATPSSPA